MSSASARFGTAINCMDGRTQIPVIEWMRKRYRVSYVDMITEPGWMQFWRRTMIPERLNP